MPLIAPPDTMGAIVDHLRSFAEIRTLVMSSKGYTAAATVEERALPRISPRRQSYWQLPQYAIRVQGPVGLPAINDSDFGLFGTRTDLFIYGPTEHDAMHLWGLVEDALCSFRAVSRAFDSAGVRFGDVQREGGPNKTFDTDANAGVILATYVFLNSGVPIS